MKPATNYITAFCMLLLLIMAACKKEKTILPERELPASLQEQADSYKSLLTAAESGWFMLYKPNDTADDIAIRLKFREDYSLSVLSGLRGYHVENNEAQFSFDGEYTLQIVFSENSVFGVITNELNGFNKFKISLQENGDFHLRRADGFDNKLIVLSRMDQESQSLLDAQIQAVLALIEEEAEMERLKAEAAEKLATLIDADPGYYFNNILTEHFGASLDVLDSTARQITLTWKTSPSNPVQQTFSYSIVPGGIALQPVITMGEYVIDTLLFGDFDDGAIEIVSAGNAGAGKMGWMHVPPFEYHTAWTGAPEGYTTADYFIRDGESPRFMGYTLDAMDIYYSDALQPYINDLKTYFTGEGFKADERFRLQFYNNNTTPTPSDHATRNQLQLLLWNASETNTFLVFYYDLQKLGPNHVSMVPFGTSGASAEPYKEKVLEFMNEIFTEEGFTVVPAGRNGTGATAVQIIRLVSRKDSRIWLQMLVTNFPTPVYFD